MKEEDRRRRSIKDGLVRGAARDESGGVGGGSLDVTEPDAVGRRRGLGAVWRMMACMAQ